MGDLEETLQRPELTRRPAPDRLRGVATVTCLIVAAGISWFSTIAVPAVRFAPAVVLAALPGLLLVGGLSRRVATCTAVVCVPAVMFVAGVPPAALVPQDWPQLVGRVGSGVTRLIAPASGVSPGTIAWSLAAVLLASGGLWMAGGIAVASDAVSMRRLIIAFALFAAPWLAAVCVSTPGHAAWLGALVLLAGVLWFSNAALMVSLGVATALLSVAIAQAVGPHARWFGLGRPASSNLQFDSLDTLPTYGPLTDRRTGVAMLKVTAPKPALWRVQTLDYFDGGGWTTGPYALPELPQPAARREGITVRVLGLRQNLVVAPGRVDRVVARGSVARISGEAWQLDDMPQAGDSYRVVASVVRVSPGQLARDQTPLDPRARGYTGLGLATQGAIATPFLHWIFESFGLSVAALARPTVDPRVVSLARELEVGARTEWEKVVRVERFLDDGRRFRYTTRLPYPGPHPVVDFLLHTHAGDCEHFAGAAALLLRLAGIPVRVVAGFATGRQVGSGQYVVRDLDAHDWIEVYFPGDGWVPFNPTPSASPATIASGLDPLSFATPPGRGRGRVPLAEWLYALAFSAALVLAVGRSRRRSRRAPDPLELVARRTGVRLEPSTTLAQLGVVMARLGPRTAALAAESERARFAKGPSAAPRHRRIRLARALVGDVGPLRALLIFAPAPLRVRRWLGVVAPAADEREEQERQQ